MKVLMADDDASYKKSASRSFLSGYDMDFASRADELIEKARKARYSLIITDNRMEDGYGNSGIFAIEGIRKFNEEVPIILLTADTSMDIAVEALAKGANEVLSKKMKLAEIQARIRKYEQQP